MHVLPHIAYLYSRWPVVSQTFCDTEMLALEAAGFRITVASLNPPPNSFRHERLRHLKAEVLYPPPSAVLDVPVASEEWHMLEVMANDHHLRFGGQHKAATRARNASYVFHELKRRGVQHVHVHFANRATHTALFLKKLGLPFSFTAHAQDFMVDLGSDDLLREMVQEAEFVVTVTDFSRDLLTEKCPGAAAKILRIYNGIDAASFPTARGRSQAGLRIVSIGRLIDFKGFAHLIAAVALLKDRGVDVSLQIVGDGPLHGELEAQIKHHGLTNRVILRGVLSQDEIKRELADADVFALACIVDSKGASDILPTVILEAMATGLSVVSTVLAGVPEMVVHGETGLLSMPGDVDEMMQNLALLAEDAALRMRMGDAGRRRVIDIFSLDRTAGELARLFQKNLTTEFSPATVVLQPDVLCLLDSWPPPNDIVLEEELTFLKENSRVTLLAGTAGQKITYLPPGIEFLPDAMVLEATWKHEPDLAARAEALRGKCNGWDGEEFFRAARRAVYLAVCNRHRQWRHVHALRASSLLWAWMFHQLTGSSASGSVEAGHGLGRGGLAQVLGSLEFANVADPKLHDGHTDALGLAPPVRRARILGIFPRATPSARSCPVKSVWENWLARIGEQKTN